MTRYMIEERTLGDEADLVEIAHHDGDDGLESARAALARRVDDLLAARPGLEAIPDTIRFMERPDALVIRVFPAVGVGNCVAVKRFTVIDASRRHCGTCLCVVAAR